MNKNQIHKNRKEDWETPPKIFNPLNDYYGFTIDLAANETNHKLARWIGPGSQIHTDFLQVGHTSLEDETCWINPPYGAYLKTWTQHIKYLAKYNTPIVALLPGSIDTAWFWANVHNQTGAIFGRRGRIQFLPRGKSGNPGPSILAAYNLSAKNAPPGWSLL